MGVPQMFQALGDCQWENQGNEWDNHPCGSPTWIQDTKQITSWLTSGQVAQDNFQQTKIDLGRWTKNMLVGGLEHGWNIFPYCSHINWEFHTPN